MIAAQPPPLAVLIWAQTVPGADMPSQRLSAVAAIETDQIFPVHGTTHGYSGNENLSWSGWLPKLTDRPVNGGNQDRKSVV